MRWTPFASPTVAGCCRWPRAISDHDPDVSDVAAELADLAAAALEAALAIARAEVGDEADGVRIAVIGMGKCGGRELNYVSDVDVIYVVEPDDGVDEVVATRIGDRLAGALARACSTVTAEGSLWEVDAGLRPEGRAGALTRTLASHLAYYQRWAKTWEFQALLKARPVAGDEALGLAYLEAIGPLVWQAAGREGFVGDVQKMRRRVEAHVPQAEADRQLKLGPGGLRDIEFAVQLLQLVHGRTDESVRSGNTLAALADLAAGGYVGRDDAASMADAYRYLRTLEHRLQLRRLRRTHLMPSDPAALRVLGRSLGYTRDPVDELMSQWRRHAREVRRLHEKLFYRPLLAAVARLDAGESRLTPDAARARMEALGYADPAGALRHLEALTSGVSRRASIQRTLLPVMLGWFADAPDPDAGLLAFRRVSEALGSTHWYLALLRDAGATAERLARVLASSRFATDLLLRAPDAVSLLAADDSLRPRSLEELQGEMAATAGRAESAELAAEAVRAIRRRELFRLAASEVLDRVGPDHSGPALTDVAQAALSTVLEVVRAGQTQQAPARFAVIGMGRFGGRELSLASDLDVLFVFDPVPGADEHEATESRAVGGHRAAAAADPACPRPADGPRRGPEAGRTQRCARPKPRLLPCVLRALVTDVGEPGAPARAAHGRGCRAGCRVHRADRPPPLAGRGTVTGGRHRDPSDQGSGGVRAPAARGGPRTAHQARARRSR